MMHLRLAISKSAGRTCISSRPVIAQFSQLAHDLQSDFVPRSKVEGRRESSSAFQIDDNGDSFMRDLVNVRNSSLLFVQFHTNKAFSPISMLTLSRFNKS